MIKRIKKIKNAGIFGYYSWDASLPEFKRYNLIYGWNWCGKTTLSNLFAALKTGFSDKHPEIEYEIETQSGNFKEGSPYSNKVMVFNQDYIKKNVPVLSGKANHIFIIGEENKRIAEVIKKDEQLLSEKKGGLRKVSDNKESQIKQKDKLFTDIARTISTNTSGETTRTYRKPNAETAFQRLTAKEILNEPDIEKHNLTLRQTEKPVIDNLNIPKSKYRDEEKELDLSDLLEKFINETKDLSAQTVESIIIDRLKRNSDISKWVEEGIELHEKHKSQICEYCNQPLLDKRVKELANHFSKSDRDIKISIDILVEELKKVSSLIDEIKSVDKANLYGDIQSKYKSEVQSFGVVKKDILDKITRIGVLLKEMKSKTTEVLKLDIDIDINLLIAAVEKINVEIRKHNKKTNNFQDEKAIAQTKLENHYLSTIYDDVKEFEDKIATSEAEIERFKDGDPDNPSEIGIKSLIKQIDENKATISSTHKACDEINKGLEGFLGRNDIVFEVQDEGYEIKRNGKVAADLSEGEKTAITFVYFTVHLRSQDFDIKEGIVVIDDPVSSFDSNSLFQAFAFLKNAVKDASQIFILTHSFDFLRLLLNWTKRIPGREGEKRYYMIKNKYIDNARQAYIAAMDKNLEKYESEYHYLFKILHTFKSDGSIGHAYPIPNIARKALETFLMFRVPSSASMYNKMEALKPYFDENKLTAIYKFTNSLSHITGKGFDPALVPETQKNVEYLLDMMKQVFPEHFKILVDSI